jgi:precorrin-2/cobalt-factor-2 C20-methyltransferase
MRARRAPAPAADSVAAAAPRAAAGSAPDPRPTGPRTTDAGATDPRPTDAGATGPRPKAATPDPRAAGAGPQAGGPGRLYGVGLGPGDPDLLTLKAHRLIRAAGVIAYPQAEGGASLARAIAAPFLPAGVEEIPIPIPMTEARAPAQGAYDAAAARLGAVLAGGRDVVVLCEGDPFFYGSFMYLFARLARRFAVETVPGVTSVAAAAAAAGLPLVARNEPLTILPGPLPDAELRPRLALADSVALLKVGRHLPRLRALLDDMGLTARARYVERASLPGQRICPLAEAPAAAPYFSMILVTRGADPWL